MTPDEKLAAILAAVQVDPGNRGLAKLFPVCAADFAAACRSIAEHKYPHVDIWTGFYIPTADPPAFETDGPLGAVFLAKSLHHLGITVSCCGDLSDLLIRHSFGSIVSTGRPYFISHRVWIEIPGASGDGRCYSMRGRDLTEQHAHWNRISGIAFKTDAILTIGIGDGGNEIGMGKLPHELVAANVPNGDLIHCRVATDFLIIAGVSNWGAYALAAGVYVLRGKTPPSDLFDPDREREILDVMVREGLLVDGVTGKQAATVDGLSWEDYTKPLVRIREILAS